MIKLRRMRGVWVGLSGIWGEKRNAFWCLVGKRKERRPFGGLGVLRKIILKWYLNGMVDRGLG
jgi:hypothetical protein